MDTFFIVLRPHRLADVLLTAYLAFDAVHLGKSSAINFLHCGPWWPSGLRRHLDHAPWQGAWDRIPAWLNMYQCEPKM